MFKLMIWGKIRIERILVVKISEKNANNRVSNQCIVEKSKTSHKKENIKITKNVNAKVSKEAGLNVEKSKDELEAGI